MEFEWSKQRVVVDAAVQVHRWSARRGDLARYALILALIAIVAILALLFLGTPSQQDPEHGRQVDLGTHRSRFRDLTARGAFRGRLRVRCGPERRPFSYATNACPPDCRKVAIKAGFRKCWQPKLAHGGRRDRKPVVDSCVKGPGSKRVRPRPDPGSSPNGHVVGIWRRSAGGRSGLADSSVDPRRLSSPSRCPVACRPCGLRRRRRSAGRAHRGCSTTRRRPGPPAEARTSTRRSPRSGR